VTCPYLTSEDHFDKLPEEQSQFSAEMGRQAAAFSTAGWLPSATQLRLVTRLMFRLSEERNFARVLLDKARLSEAVGGGELGREAGYKALEAPDPHQTTEASVTKG